MENLNTRHRNAQMAGRASVEVYTLLFFRKGSVLADARVTRVKANGLIVFVPKYGIEGPVYLTPKGSDRNNRADFVLDEEAQSVASTDGTVRFTIFDKCAVRLAVELTAGRRQQLVLTLVPREELPPSERMG